MSHRTDRFRFRFPSKDVAGRRGEHGYALLILMMVVTLLLVALSAALPSVYVEGQREREEELLFRGTEYARAIALFHRRFNRYPATVKELLQTNGIRFLRREYRDPMSKDGKWRFIHAAANGAVLDSKTLAVPQTPAGPQVSGNEKPAMSSALFREGRRQSQTSGSLEGGEEPKGTFIMGVASSSTEDSIRVWNNHSEYDEWEFLATDVNLVGNTRPVAPGGRGPTGRPPGRFAPKGRPIPPLIPPDENPMTPH